MGIGTIQRQCSRKFNARKADQICVLRYTADQSQLLLATKTKAKSCTESRPVEICITLTGTGWPLRALAVVCTVGFATGLKRSGADLPLSPSRACLHTNGGGGAYSGPDGQCARLGNSVSLFCTGDAKFLGIHKQCGDTYKFGKKGIVASPHEGAAPIRPETVKFGHTGDAQTGNPEFQKSTKRCIWKTQ